MLYILLILFIFLLGISVIRGAPYVPTHKQQIVLALDLLDLSEGSHIVDVGSGDGRLLIEAAKRGIRATGYEINSVLYVISWIRIRKHNSLATVKLADMWREKLPKDTDAVFVFTMGRYMPKLVKKIQKEGFEQMLLVSHAFELEGYKPIKKKEAIYIYQIKRTQ